MNGTIETVETDPDPGLTTAKGVSFGATCSICDTKLTTSYYCVNGHEICPDCRRPVMSQLARQHGSIVNAFVRGWLFGAFSGASGYVFYAAAMALLKGYSGLVALFIGPIVWKLTRWANPGCSLAYRIIAISITYGSLLLSSIPGTIQNMIDEGVINSDSISEFWMSVLLWSMKWLIPFLQHPASFLIILLIGFGIGEIFRVRQQRDSLIQGPFPISRRAA
jgi:hypothetical protein